MGFNSFRRSGSGELEEKDVLQIKWRKMVPEREPEHTENMQGVERELRSHFDFLQLFASSSFRSILLKS